MTSDMNQTCYRITITVTAITLCQHKQTLAGVSVSQANQTAFRYSFTAAIGGILSVRNAKIAIISVAGNNRIIYCWLFSLRQLI